MITVDADEVTPNTGYTCNITGRIPTFTGVQLGELSVYITLFFFLLIWGGRESESPPKETISVTRVYSLNTYPTCCF